MATPEQTDTSPEHTGAQTLDMEHDSPDRFWLEAKYQGGCAVCGKGGRLTWEAHHVIHEQECTKAGIPRHAPRNVLRVCAKGADRCHERHHSGARRIPLAFLRQDNIDFAVDWLGAGRAYNYLTRHYSGADPRVDGLLA